MNRLKGGVDHSVKYRLKALESNPFDPELRERVDVTIKISASQYLLDISSLDGKRNMDSKKLCGIYSQKIQFLGRTKEIA